MAVAKGKFLVLQAQDGSVAAILAVENLAWKEVVDLQDDTFRIFGGGAQLVALNHEFVRQATDSYGAIKILKDWKRLADKEQQP